MTRAEFDRWVDFYLEQPFDDLHRYHRPAALIATSMTGGEVGDKLEWLAPQHDPELSDATVKTLAAFGFKPSDIG